MLPLYLTQEESRHIVESSWIPVEVEDETLPSWMKELPTEQRSHVYASGSNLRTSLDYDGRCVFSGMVIFRPSMDDPGQVDWTKDHYLIIQSVDNNDKLLFELSSGKHSDYLDNIPEQFKNNRVYIYKNSQEE